MLGTHVLSHVLTNPRQDPDNQAHISQTVITIDQAHISQTVITNDQAHISQTVINNNTHADIETIIDQAHDVQTEYYSTHDGQTEQCAHPTTFIETHHHDNVPTHNFKAVNDQAHESKANHSETHDLFFIHFCSIRCYRRRHCNIAE
jgi:hypothetical protein